MLINIFAVVFLLAIIVFALYLSISNEEGLSHEEQKVLILSILSNDQHHQWWYTWDIVKASDYKVDQNSVYGLLMRMVGNGIIEARFETKEECDGKKPRRRLYKITKGGRHYRSPQAETVAGKTATA